MRILKLALALTVASLAGAATAQADPLFSDGFESGDFSAWTQVQTGGDGKAVVQSGVVSTGALAAQLSETANSGSKAYVRKTFNSAQQDLTASGDFRVLQEGASGGNVPFFRFLDPASARIVSVYRQNATGGKVGLTYGGTHYSTTGVLPLNTWGTLSMHVTTNGTASTVEVRLNGSVIYQTSSASLGTAGVSTVQIGNETAAQAFTTVVDTINVQGGSPTSSPPVNTVAPTISGTPQGGQTLTANPGTLERHPADHLLLPVAALQLERRELRRDRRRPDLHRHRDDVGSTLRVGGDRDERRGRRARRRARRRWSRDLPPPVNTSLPTISGTAQSGQTPDRQPGQLERTPADHLHLPVAALQLERRELRRDRRAARPTPPPGDRRRLDPAGRRDRVERAGQASATSARRRSSRRPPRRASWWPSGTWTSSRDGDARLRSAATTGR